MFKAHKKKLIVSSVVILLPILAGLLLWDRLPDTMATHWGADGNVDGWASKAFAVFGMPPMLLAMHWFCLWVTTKDPGQKKQTSKAIGMIFWLMPIVSLVSSAVLYGTALGKEFNMGTVMFGMLGLMFLGIGNYMPKIRRNHTLGVKVVWALQNEENWNATHRFAGKVWVAGGAVILALAFLPEMAAAAAILPLILILAFIPMLYSYLYYKKQCAQGEGYSLHAEPMDPALKKLSRISMVLVAIILIGVCLIMFTGRIDYIYGEDSFTIDCSFWNDLTVEYDAIDSIELREEAVPGTREYGFGSAKLLLGVSKNEEFGLYTRYTYTDSDYAVVLNVDGNMLVLAGKTLDDTRLIYEELRARMEG